MSSPAPAPRRHTARGIAVAVVLGPLMVAGILLAAASALSYVIAGWSPSTMFGGSGADWLFGGAAGDAANYVRFAGGALVAAGCWAAIKAAFGNT